MTRFGVAIPSYGDFADGAALRDMVMAAEDLGYDGAWFADHVAIPDYAVHVSGPAWLEPLACCFIGLGATRRLRFGTDVLVAPYRNPLLVAKQAATADRLSGGRLVLALGTGYIRGEFEALEAKDYEARGAVTDEVLDVLRAVWRADGAASYDGAHYHFKDIHTEPGPLQDPLPVWVGGNHARAYRRAAERGDGWHPLFPTPEAYAEGRERILALRGSAEDFTFSYSCPGTRVLAEGQPLPALASYEGLEAPAEFDYAPPFPVNEEGRPRFVGTAELVVSDVAAFVEAGVEHFTLRFHTAGPAAGPDAFVDQMRRFAEAVMPSFAG